MGTVSSILEQIFPPAPTWSIDEIPDLHGKVFVVTGGNAGIGLETCQVLLSKNAKVYIASRCPKRVQRALEYLHQSTGKTVETLMLDLADLESVREAARELTRRETDIHCLINNGGVYAPPLEAKTAQGYDLQFGTNVLGHYLFTTLLLPTLLRTAKSSGAPVRVVNVSSLKHLFAPKGGVDYDSLVPCSPDSDRVRESMGGDKLYCQSKWGLVTFSNELARRYGSEGIISIALHPGNIRSEIMRHNLLSGMTAVLADMMLWDCSYGALTQLYAATDSEALELNGKYLVPWARPDRARLDTEDLDAGQKLWDWLYAHSR